MLAAIVRAWQTHCDAVAYATRTPQRKQCCVEAFLSNIVGDNYASLPASCTDFNITCPYFEASFFGAWGYGSDIDAEAEDTMGGDVPKESHPRSWEAPDDSSWSGWFIVAVAVLVGLVAALVWRKILRRVPVVRDNPGRVFLLFAGVIASTLGAWVPDQFDWDVFYAWGTFIGISFIAAQCSCWILCGSIRLPFGLATIIAIDAAFDAGLPMIDRWEAWEVMAMYAAIRHVSSLALCASWVYAAAFNPRLSPAAVLADVVMAASILAIRSTFDLKWGLTPIDPALIKIMVHSGALVIVGLTIRTTGNRQSLKSGVSAVGSFSVAVGYLIHQLWGWEHMWPYGAAFVVLQATLEGLWWGLAGVNKGLRMWVMCAEVFVVAVPLYIASFNVGLVPYLFSLEGYLTTRLAVEAMKRSLKLDLNSPFQRWRASVGMVLGSWTLAMVTYRFCLSLSWSATDDFLLSFLEKAPEFVTVKTMVPLMAVFRCVGQRREHRARMALVKYYADVAVVALCLASLYAGSWGGAGDFPTAVVVAELWVLGLFQVQLLLSLASRHRFPVSVLLTSVAIATSSAGVVWLVHDRLTGWIDVPTFAWAVNISMAILLSRAKARRRLETAAVEANAPAADGGG